MAANSSLTATVMVTFMLASVADISDCALVNSSILSDSCFIDFSGGLQMLQIHVKFSNPFNNLYCAIDILLQSIHCRLLHTSQLAVNDLVNIGEMPWKEFGKIVIGGKECNRVEFECSK